MREEHKGKSYILKKLFSVFIVCTLVFLSVPADVFADGDALQSIPPAPSDAEMPVDNDNNISAETGSTEADADDQTKLGEDILNDNIEKSSKETAKTTGEPNPATIASSPTPAAYEQHTLSDPDGLVTITYTAYKEGTIEEIGNYQWVENEKITDKGFVGTSGKVYLVSLPYDAGLDYNDIVIKTPELKKKSGYSYWWSLDVPKHYKTLAQAFKNKGGYRLLEDEEFVTLTSADGEEFKNVLDSIGYPNGYNIPTEDVKGCIFMPYPNIDDGYTTTNVYFIQISTKEPEDFGGMWQGSGTEEDPFLLSDSEDLKNLTDSVSGTKHYENTYFKFTDDLTLPEDWKPIGTDIGFAGIIDGNGKTLTVPEGSLSLIGKPIKGAVVKNLNIYGKKIPGYGLVQQYETGCIMTIENVTVKSGSHILYSGLIGGYGNTSVTIRGCTVEKGVVIGDDGSGFWGDLGDTTYRYEWVGECDHRDLIGSFAGAFNGTITDCVSYATVYGRNNVGGIVGMKGQSMRDFYVNNCAFYGDIVATGEIVGGIVGGGYTAGSAPLSPCVNIENCYATGSITGGNYVGGIFGGEKGLGRAMNNGIGRVRNNYFCGTLTASSKDSPCVGGIIGYMNVVGIYNVICDNYYLSNSADRGIGRIGKVNTDERQDEPDGSGADKLAKAVSRNDLTNGELLKSLNASKTGGRKYEQGAQYPVFAKDGEKYVTLITSQDVLESNPEKNVYVGTDYSKLCNYDIDVYYSDGTQKRIKASEGSFSGIDFTSAGKQLAALSYEGYDFIFGVNVSEAPADTLAVYLTVMGDTSHGEPSGTLHTMTAGNLTEWFAKRSYMIGKGYTEGTTVKDLIERCFSTEGISYKNESGNYLQEVTFNGTTLGEFTNGPNSGWMYMVNGKIINDGIAEYKLKYGDNVVLFYTDDYTKETWGTGVTAADVIAMIKALPDTDKLTIVDAAAVAEAQSAYASLNDAEKAKVPQALKDKLTAAVKRMAELKKASVEGFEDAYKNTGSYLSKNIGKDGLTVGEVGGDWTALGLARSGSMTKAQKEAYYNNVAAYVKQNANAKEQLHWAKSTENSRVILALTAAGYDASDIDSHDLLQGLTDMDFIEYQGVNGPIWALIAFDSHGYEIPEVTAGGRQATREGLIEDILLCQLGNGGWNLSGLGAAEPDMTAMALQALAPYYDSSDEVRGAVDRGLRSLSDMQQADGGYIMWGDSNSESCAQVVVALTALGIDPATDSRFIKNGNSVMDALLSYYVKGGGFRHLAGGKVDGMATEQGYYALAAYDRFVNGKNSLYNMNDVALTVGGIGEDTVVQTSAAPVEKAEVKDVVKRAAGRSISAKDTETAAAGWAFTGAKYTGDTTSGGAAAAADSVPVWIIIAAICVAAAIALAAAYFRRKHRTDER